MLDRLDDDLLLSVVARLSSAADLARCRAVSTSLKVQADNDALWEGHCRKEGLERNGSSRLTSRTYRSWQQSWLDARCDGCGSTYMVKINLDGGSSSASTWHGAKVPLCKGCAIRALYVYRATPPAAITATLFPRMQKYEPLEQFVVRICGRNVDGMVKELGLAKDYERFLQCEMHIHTDARAGQ
jgi:hypothetical protein